MGTPDLVPADSVEATVLVDNVSDLLSTVPRDVTGEVPNLFRAGARRLAGQCLCCAHWGLSLVITVRGDGRERSLLFDAGPEGYAVRRNGKRLGIGFSSLSEIVLSHGHWDHAGGLLEALRLAREGRQDPVPVHVNPGMFLTRGMLTAKGDVIPFQDIPTPAAIAAAGGAVVNEARERVLIDGLAHLSGEIPRVTAYEQGLPGHVKREGREWQPDPWIMDERYLAVRLEAKGVVVFTSCSHAGVVNVLLHARDRFAPDPLYAVIGGFHLSGAACETIIPQTVDDLRQFGLRRIFPGHCTGWRAIHALVNAFGEEVVTPSAVGRTYRI